MKKRRNQEVKDNEQKKENNSIDHFNNVGVYHTCVSRCCADCKGPHGGIRLHYSWQTCPADNLDPHMALVTDFVLFLGKGSEHYLLPNIPRSVKAQ